MKNFLKNEKYLGGILVGLAFLIMFIWAMIGTMPTGPDEGMRYSVAQYLYKNPGKLPHGDDEALLQLRVLPPDDEDAYAGVAECPARRLDAQDVGLSAASGAAVGHIPVSGLAEQLLLWVQLPEVHRDHVSFVVMGHVLTISCPVLKKRAPAYPNEGPLVGARIYQA